eukprot:g244.t1
MQKELEEQDRLLRFFKSRKELLKLGFDAKVIDANLQNTDGYFEPALELCLTPSKEQDRKDASYSLPKKSKLSRSHSLDSTSLLDVAKRARVELERIQKFCFETQTPFFDESFNGSKAIGRTRKEQVVGWRRVLDIDSRGFLIRSDPKATDVNQGSVGNCWFLAGVSVIAERPSVLKNIFNIGVAKYSGVIPRIDRKEKKSKVIVGEVIDQAIPLNEIGLYSIRLCIDGQWEVIFIDDHLPIDQYGRLVFSKVQRGQFFVPFLEKAFAKACGSYQGMASGHSDEALEILTGWPTVSIHLDRSQSGSLKMEFSTDTSDTFSSSQFHPSKSSLIFALVESYHNEGSLLCASCGSKTSEREIEAYGLVSNHAYAILDVVSLSDPFGHGKIHQLLKFRNPHGGDQNWNGNWSWQDTKRQDMLRQIEDERNIRNESNSIIRTSSSNVFSSSQKKRNPQSGDLNGTFWMSIEDCMRYFQTINVCRLRKGFQESGRQSLWLNAKLTQGLAEDSNSSARSKKNKYEGKASEGKTDNTGEMGCSRMVSGVDSPWIYEGIDLEVFGSTEVMLQLVQPNTRRSRETAVVLADLGYIVVRKDDFKTITLKDRNVKRTVHGDCVLTDTEGSNNFLLIPLSFMRRDFAVEAFRVNFCVFHSCGNPVVASKYHLAPTQLRRALFEYIRSPLHKKEDGHVTELIAEDSAHRKHAVEQELYVGNDVSFAKLQDNAGIMFCAWLTDTGREGYLGGGGGYLAGGGDRVVEVNITHVGGLQSLRYEDATRGNHKTILSRKQPRAIIDVLTKAGGDAAGWSLEYERTIRSRGLFESRGEDDVLFQSF